MIFGPHEKKVLAHDTIDPKMAVPILAILDQSPSMLAYWDGGLVCRYANKAYHTWFGVEGEQLTGTNLKDLLGLKLFTLNEPFIRAALRGEPQHFQRKIEHGGVARQGLASYLPHIVNGKVMGFVAEVNDVTALHETHRALQDEWFSTTSPGTSCARARQRCARRKNWRIWEAGNGRLNPISLCGRSSFTISLGVIHHNFPRPFWNTRTSIQNKAGTS